MKSAVATESTNSQFESEGGIERPGRFPRPVRRAFTLVELLVVIAIIGTLIALLLPAVQAARESGRRAQCANNLHQIGVACGAHMEALGAFPNGGYGPACPRTLLNGAPAPYDKQQWSWGYQILPYTDQQALWSNLNDKTVASTPIAFYFCPSRRRPVALIGGIWQDTAFNYPRGMTDYAGNAGVTAGLDTASDDGDYGDSDGLVDGVVVRQGWARPNGASGSAVQIPATSTPGSTPISEASITDGMSNTLLVGEKRMNINYCTTQCQPDDNDGYVGGFQDDVVRWGAFTPAPDWQGPLAAQPASFATLAPNDYQFGSSHPGAAQFVFCDGHVLGIHFKVDAGVFMQASRRNDGVPYDAGQL
jgi:prepilin-type N-terminal cleavage/methylation domain-containing protein/prepilin-type processing-associated H-X9-DG protein